MLSCHVCRQPLRPGDGAICPACRAALVKDRATEDYFQPRGELASLFGNDVGHLAEPAVRIPKEKIGAGLTKAKS